MNNTQYLDSAYSVFTYASKQINDSPNAHSSLLDSYLLKEKPFVIIILKAESTYKDLALWLDPLVNLNKPYIDYYHVPKNNTGYSNIDDKILLGEVTAYICTDYTCEEPICDLEEFISRINLL